MKKLPRGLTFREKISQATSGKRISGEDRLGKRREENKGKRQWRGGRLGRLHRQQGRHCLRSGQFENCRESDVQSGAAHHESAPCEGRAKAVRSTPVFSWHRAALILADTHGFIKRQRTNLKVFLITCQKIRVYTLLIIARNVINRVCLLCLYYGNPILLLINHQIMRRIPIH
jgi:hypothetical protein